MKLDLPMAVTGDVLTATNATASEAAWSAVTSYADEVAVRRMKNGQEYRFISQAGSNLNHDPATDDGTWWLEDGVTNPYAMFDGGIFTQTIAADELTVTLQLPPAQIVNAIYFANIRARTLRVVVDDPIDGIVRDQTFDLVSTVGVSDWWNYFFLPPRRLREKYVTGLGNYAGATITITLSDYGDLVSCGLCLPSFSRRLGGTRFGLQTGIVSYSVKQRDDFGNLVIVPREYAKTADFTIVVEGAFLDAVTEMLTDVRDTPVLFVGDDRYDTMKVFGFFKDFSDDFFSHKLSYLTLSLEGLT